MNFKYSCFTENTPEMREWLESIGYKRNINIMNNYPHEYEDIERWLVANSVEYFTVRPNYQGKHSVDCLGNPALFKAVTAVREDSDYMQWFVSNDGNEFNLCTKRLNVYSGVLCRKATLSELQEHFKIK